MFSIIVGIFTNFIGLHPIKALIYSAIINGIIAPIIIFFIVQISSNHKTMGHYKNGKLSKFIGWLAIILMSITAIATIVALI